MKFSNMKYERPDIDAVISNIEKYKEKVDNAQSADELYNIIKSYDEESNIFDTTAQLAQVRHSIDTRDEFYEKENDFLNENLPIVTAKENELFRKVKDSRFRKEIEEKIGVHFFDILDCKLAVDDRAIPYLQKENDLSDRYERIRATSKIELDGKTYTLTQMSPMLQDVDREKRKKAFKAVNEFYKKNQDKIEEIYSELVKVRTEMAKALGYDSYIDLKYKMLMRTDYNSKDVAEYRKKVLKNITPLAVKLRKKHAERLGIDDFKFYDRAVVFKDGNSKPHGDYNFIIENAQKMYHELSRETGEFFDFMVENELMDLLAKPGKMAGGYCTSFNQYSSPFIFANFNGTNGDIDVITHEAGHAFQVYMSKGKSLSAYLWPTYEACEIHSMSMEFLTWPWMDKFFGKDADKFRYSALLDAIAFIPYGVTIDHFQHFVYENPDATPEERRKKYHELEMMYQPDLDYDDEFLSSGTYWYRQGHVFSEAFYYIDYTLAQVCAFQYLVKSIENREKAIEDYMNICKAGGEYSFFKIMEIGNIKNPMNTDVMEEVIPKLEKILNAVEPR